MSLSVHSNDSGLLKLPRVNLHTNSEIMFSCYSPRLQNVLPQDIREAKSCILISSEDMLFEQAFFSIADSS